MILLNKKQIFLGVIFVSWIRRLLTFCSKFPVPAASEPLGVSTGVKNPLWAAIGPLNG